MKFDYEYAPELNCIDLVGINVLVQKSFTQQKERD